MYEGKTRYQASDVADDYDRRRFTSIKGNWTDNREKACLLSLLADMPKSGSALDIPCGTGRMTELLLERGMQVTATDISEAMMRHAESKTSKYGSQVRFAKADVEDLEFADNSFDLIVTIRLLHHMPQAIRRKVLVELHRVTKKWVAVTYSNKFSFQSIRRDLVANTKGERRYSISRREFESDVASAGLRIAKYIRLFPVVSESVFVLLEKQ